MSDVLARPATHRIELSAIADDAWRLCDREASPNDAASVIAYVEKTASGYDVVWLHGPHGESHVAALDEVEAAAAARLGCRVSMGDAVAHPRRGAHGSAVQHVRGAHEREVR